MTGMTVRWRRCDWGGRDTPPSLLAIGTAPDGMRAQAWLPVDTPDHRVEGLARPPLDEAMRTPGRACRPDRTPLAKDIRRTYGR